MFASATERFLHFRVGQELLSHEGRIVVIVIYLLSILAACYGVTQVKIDFSVEFFIGDTAYVKPFFDLNDKYFRQGLRATIYNDNENLDWTAEET